MKKKELEIKVQEESKAVDHIETYKRWLDKLKHFYTVKVLPARLK